MNNKNNNNNNDNNSNTTIEKRINITQIKLLKKGAYKLEDKIYGMSKGQLSTELKEEFQKYLNFMTVSFFGQQEECIRLVTAKMYEGQVLLFLGWYKNIYLKNDINNNNDNNNKNDINNNNDNNNKNNVDNNKDVDKNNDNDKLTLKLLVPR
jgi:hypothetical protein